MDFVLQAIAFIFDPQNLFGEKGIVPRLGEHLLYTGISMAIALVIAIPLGLFIGHTGRGRNVAVASTSSFRAVPTFGLLLYFVLLNGIGLWPVVAVLVILAVPPLLAGVYSGLLAIDRRTIDAARGVGMTELQILRKVEIPLALPIVIGGIRNATLQVIATATIAAYVGLGGLGRFIIEGLALHDFVLALAGAILVLVLALVVDLALAGIQKLVLPAGVVQSLSGRSRNRDRKFPAGLAQLREG